MRLGRFFLDLFFPRSCINCQSEGEYLCQDCFALVDFPPYSPQKCSNLSFLFSAVPYQNFIIKKLIRQFKYEPHVKDLAKTLASLIIHQLQTAEKDVFAANLKKEQMAFPQADFLIPIPLAKNAQRKRGFNQAEEIAKELSKFFGIPLESNLLLKNKETSAQADLSKKERGENIKGVFHLKNEFGLKGKKVILVDDVFTTGATMQEAALVLKAAGVKKIYGITVARE